MRLCRRNFVAELEKRILMSARMDISDDGKVVFTNVKEEGFLYKQMSPYFSS